jgi:hypothetical protein
MIGFYRKILNKKLFDTIMFGAVCQRATSLFTFAIIFINFLLSFFVLSIVLSFLSLPFQMIAVSRTKIWNLSYLLRDCPNKAALNETCIVYHIYCPLAKLCRQFPPQVLDLNPLRLSDKSSALWVNNLGGGMKGRLTNLLGHVLTS